MADDRQAKISEALKSPLALKDALRVVGSKTLRHSLIHATAMAVEKTRDDPARVARCLRGLVAVCNTFEEIGQSPYNESALPTERITDQQGWDILATQAAYVLEGPNRTAFNVNPMSNDIQGKSVYLSKLIRDYQFLGRFLEAIRPLINGYKSSAIETFETFLNVSHYILFRVNWHDNQASFEKLFNARRNLKKWFASTADYWLGWFRGAGTPPPNNNDTTNNNNSNEPEDEIEARKKLAIYRSLSSYVLAEAEFHVHERAYTVFEAHMIALHAIAVHIAKVLIPRYMAVVILMMEKWTIWHGYTDSVSLSPLILPVGKCVDRNGNVIAETDLLSRQKKMREIAIGYAIGAMVSAQARRETIGRAGSDAAAGPLFELDDYTAPLPASLSSSALLNGRIKDLHMFNSENGLINEYDVLLLANNGGVKTPMVLCSIQQRALLNLALSIEKNHEQLLQQAEDEVNATVDNPVNQPVLEELRDYDKLFSVTERTFALLQSLQRVEQDGAISAAASHVATIEANISLLAIQKRYENERKSKDQPIQARPNPRRIAAPPPDETKIKLYCRQVGELAVTRLTRQLKTLQRMLLPEWVTPEGIADAEKAAASARSNPPPSQQQQPNNGNNNNPIKLPPDYTILGKAINDFDGFPGHLELKWIHFDRIRACLEVFRTTSAIAATFPSMEVPAIRDSDNWIILFTHYRALFQPAIELIEQIYKGSYDDNDNNNINESAQRLRSFPTNRYLQELTHLWNGMKFIYDMSGVMLPPVPPPQYSSVLEELSAPNSLNPTGNEEIDKVKRQDLLARLVEQNQVEGLAHMRELLSQSKTVANDARRLPTASTRIKYSQYALDNKLLAVDDRTFKTAPFLVATIGYSIGYLAWHQTGWLLPEVFRFAGSPTAPMFAPSQIVWQLHAWYKFKEISPYWSTDSLLLLDCDVESQWHRSHHVKRYGVFIATQCLKTAAVASIAMAGVNDLVGGGAIDPRFFVAGIVGGAILGLVLSLIPILFPRKWSFRDVDNRTTSWLERAAVTFSIRNTALYFLQRSFPGTFTSASTALGGDGGTGNIQMGGMVAQPLADAPPGWLSRTFSNYIATPVANAAASSFEAAKDLTSNIGGRISLDISIPLGTYVTIGIVAALYNWDRIWGAFRGTQAARLAEVQIRQQEVNLEMSEIRLQTGRDGRQRARGLQPGTEPVVDRLQRAKEYGQGVATAFLVSSALPFLTILVNALTK